MFFMTACAAFVAQLAGLLARHPVLFVLGPPLSGKTRLCELLHAHLVSEPSPMRAVMIRAAAAATTTTTETTTPESFTSLFEQQCGFAFPQFSDDPKAVPLVVLVDDTHTLFHDGQLWGGFIKDAMDGRWGGNRFQFVLFSGRAYCPYAHRDIRGLVVIPPEITITLDSASPQWSSAPPPPGLRLTRHELDEMLMSIDAPRGVGDAVWAACSGHVGLVGLVWTFLEARFAAKMTGGDAERQRQQLLDGIQEELTSVSLRRFLVHTTRPRGIFATVDALVRMVQTQALRNAEAVIPQLRRLLNAVASVQDQDGQDCRRGLELTYSELWRVPGGMEAADQLLDRGWLYVEPHRGRLRFPSCLHRAIWIASTDGDHDGA